MKNAAQLPLALSTLRSGVVSPEVALQLEGREIMQVEDRFEVVKMTIGAFLTWVKSTTPIYVHRNEAFQVNSNLANYLNKSYLPQGQFAAIFCEGNFYLVDGNTQRHLWMVRPWVKVPSHIWVSVMVTEDLSEAKQFHSDWHSGQFKKSPQESMLKLMEIAGVQTKTLLPKLNASLTLKQRLSKFLGIPLPEVSVDYVGSRETLNNEMRMLLHVSDASPQLGESEIIPGPTLKTRLQAEFALLKN